MHLIIKVRIKWATAMICLLHDLSEIPSLSCVCLNHKQDNDTSTTWQHSFEIVKLDNESLIQHDSPRTIRSSDERTPWKQSVIKIIISNFYKPQCLKHTVSTDAAPKPLCSHVKNQNRARTVRCHLVDCIFSEAVGFKYSHHLEKVTKASSKVRHCIFF